jgi:predicted nucleic acid-binding protein
MGKRYGVNDIPTLSERTVFFDANVILYLYFTRSYNSWQRRYSQIFSKLLARKNRLTVDFIVLSEVINRALREEHEYYVTANGPCRFKTYRDSADGQMALSNIFDIIQNVIYPIFDVTGRSYDKSDILSFMTIDRLDFNDRAISLLCKDQDFVLLTNDKDFAGSDLDILSANPNLSA